jgi:hypothetical protein
MTRRVIYTDVTMSDLRDQLLYIQNKISRLHVEEGDSFYIIINYPGRKKVEQFKNTVRAILGYLMPNPQYSLYTSIRGRSYEVEDSLRKCLKGSRGNMSFIYMGLYDR